jgi:type IV pilus assembly protein PilE
MIRRSLIPRPVRRGPRGFTLIELMITVMVIGVLSAIAIPNYTQYVQRANRVEGKAALLKMAGAEERYFTVNNTYTGTYGLLGVNQFSGDASAGSKYDLVITAPNGGFASGYVITATPRSTDSVCGNLTLDYLGNKGQSVGTQALCW